jgi:lysophospholipase L1-like esterase
MLLASVVMVAVASEVLIRSLVRFELPAQIGEATLDAAENATAFEVDPDRFWRLRPNVRFRDDHPALPGFVSNGQRLRNPSTISSKKGSDELRLLFIGDSVTFGWGVEQGETYVENTARVLKQRFPQLQTLAINAGVPAYSLFQGWRYLTTGLLDFEPDIVVIGSFGFTGSMPWGGISDFEQHARFQVSQPPPWLQWSHTARFVSQLLNRPGEQAESTATPSRPRLNSVEFRDLLGRIHQATRERGAQLLVVIPAHENNINGRVPPGTWGPLQSVLGDFAQSLRLGVVAEPALVDGAGLLFELSQQHEWSELMLDKVHPTPRFHAALADRVADRISPWIQTQVEFGRFGAGR